MDHSIDNDQRHSPPLIFPIEGVHDTAYREHPTWFSSKGFLFLFIITWKPDLHYSAMPLRALDVDRTSMIMNNGITNG